ncbi:hypothetical protein [Microbacterium capsulatum]|uniref:LysM domain-containing protein n=1 Tax=Microbacterium capsulatum TaxID=3041921 RepID=A0ABU0XIK7_9MICO|nr:hypothetical protein [Microbacterium sp. ASV81]MDQ4214941.1 hypothetical protein [Microbacterium sp. ASV81]
MKRAAVVTYTIAWLAVVGLVTLAAPPFVAVITTSAHPLPTKENAPEVAPGPTVTPTPDPDRVIWLGEDEPVKVSDLPNGCTTYSKIEIFGVNTHTSDAGPFYGRLIGEPQDRGSSQGATGTVNRDAAGNIVSYTAAPGDDTWSIGARLCTNRYWIGRYNHIGSDRGDHTLQPGETVVVRPDMKVEWVPGT